jgi:hypothetical protein
MTIKNNTINIKITSGAVAIVYILYILEISPL